MDCRECCTNIQPFIRKTLNYKEIRQLINHVSNCPKCQDELKTQYLVIEGLKRLENGGDYNLISDFDYMYEQQVSDNEKIHRSRLFIGGVIAAVIVLTVFTLILAII